MNPNKAHVYGIRAENTINGTISSGAKMNSGTLTIPVTYFINGQIQQKTVTIVFTQGNIGKNGISNNIK